MRGLFLAKTWNQLAYFDKKCRFWFLSMKLFRDKGLFKIRCDGRMSLKRPSWMAVTPFVCTIELVTCFFQVGPVSPPPLGKRLPLKTDVILVAKSHLGPHQPWSQSGANPIANRLSTSSCLVSFFLFQVLPEPLVHGFVVIFKCLYIWKIHVF